MEEQIFRQENHIFDIVFLLKNKNHTVSIHDNPFYPL